jgi:hypothetical protein
VRVYDSSRRKEFLLLLVLLLLLLFNLFNLFVSLYHRLYHPLSIVDRVVIEWIPDFTRGLVLVQVQVKFDRSIHRSINTSPLMNQSNESSPIIKCGAPSDLIAIQVYS